MHDATSMRKISVTAFLEYATIDLGWDVIAYEMTCKCNGHSRRVWFFRALPLEILVGWLVDGER